MKLDVTLGDLTKIGKSQKYTLSVDVEGGKLVVLKKQKDSQEDWNTFTHDKSEGGRGGPVGGGSQHPKLRRSRGGASLWGWERRGVPVRGVPAPWGTPGAGDFFGGRDGNGVLCPPQTPLPALPPVRQLIKSQRVQNKLGIVFEKEKDKTQRKDFVFVSARVGRGGGGGGQRDPRKDGVWRGGAGFNPQTPMGAWG